jgi:hypothetical protein
MRPCSYCDRDFTVRHGALPSDLRKASHKINPNDFGSRKTFPVGARTVSSADRGVGRLLTKFWGRGPRGGLTRSKLGSRLGRHQAELRKESHLVEIKVLGLDLAILNLEDRNAVNGDMVSGSWYLTLRCNQRCRMGTAEVVFGDDVRPTVEPKKFGELAIGKRRDKRAPGCAYLISPSDRRPRNRNVSIGGI